MNTREANPAASDALMVDAQHPWLGLASFTESTRAYFYGREDEVAELVRRVQRKTLTVLFGQSGLGKTSILNAGVVPRLRGQGYCPVYVRIDYAADAPTPAEQIKQAIQRAARSSGRWTQEGVAAEGETLWEFLHHRDDQLLDENGQPVLPLLIFDQFEEIFTVGQADEAGRERAARFIADLADLVENRAPQALEARLLDDDQAFERFDFTRCDYRVLIALREDYLAHLEGLKGQMPSITQNRMRLAPMNGTQALAAVRGPGDGLVSEEVAEAIVRFVAGGAELAHAEVEPSLLSLICRELNDARIAQDRREISVDLLAGSHAAILSDFYERALADQPAALRRFIEDVLLTDSGYRENVAEERVRQAFVDAGAAPDALALLVNRRLLRVEERLDLRRVELTHDVLCSVVKASRDLRREREAREASERQLQEQKDRARLARRQLRQARAVAAVCVVLSVLALVATGFAWQARQRAQAAEAAAQQTRLMADNARSQAESLLSFLVDDFYQELEPLGRLDIVLSLNQRAVDYYKHLPESLRSSDTERNYALAEVRLAGSLQSQNRSKESAQPLADAIGRLEALRTAGDSSLATTMGLAAAERALARQYTSNSSFVDAIKHSQRAVDLLRDRATAADASKPLRLLYCQALQFLGYSQVRNSDFSDAVRSERAAQAAAATMLDGPELDERATNAYVLAAPWLIEALAGLGRYDEFSEVAKQSVARADTLLQRRPHHRAVLGARATIYSMEVELAVKRMQLPEAERLARASIADYQDITRNDVSDSNAWNNLSTNYVGLSLALYEAGKVKASANAFAQALAAIAHARPTNFTLFNTLEGETSLASVLADLGDPANGERHQATARELSRKLRPRDASTYDSDVASLECLLSQTDADILLARGAYRAASDKLGKALAILRSMPAKTEDERMNRIHCEIGSAPERGEPLVRQGQFAALEQDLQTTVAFVKPEEVDSFYFERYFSRVRLWLALAQARQGALDAARKTLEPVLKLHEAQVLKSPLAAIERVDLASALYVQALAEPARRTALLARSLALLDALPPEVRLLRTARLWRDWVLAEQHQGGT